MAKTVPPDVLANLTDALKRLDAGAGSAVRRVTSSMAVSDELARTLVALYEASADAAAGFAARMYDDVREHEVGKALPASTVSGFDRQSAVARVAALLNGGLDDVAVGRLERLASYWVRRAAGACVTLNARRDPLGPAFARVPTGPETCEFCVMLASRGYVYHSAESAGSLTHWHANCDCVIVPRFDESYEIEGYDPNRYLDIYLDGYTEARDSSGAIDWEATTKATLKAMRHQLGRGGKPQGR